MKREREGRVRKEGNRKKGGLKAGINSQLLGFTGPALSQQRSINSLKTQGNCREKQVVIRGCITMGSNTPTSSAPNHGNSTMGWVTSAKFFNHGKLTN